MTAATATTLRRDPAVEDRGPTILGVPRRWAIVGALILVALVVLAWSRK